MSQLIANSHRALQWLIMNNHNLYPVLNGILSATKSEISRRILRENTASLSVPDIIRLARHSFDSRRHSAIPPVELFDTTSQQGTADFEARLEELCSAQAEILRTSPSNINNASLTNVICNVSPRGVDVRFIGLLHFDTLAYELHVTLDITSSQIPAVNFNTEFKDGTTTGTMFIGAGAISSTSPYAANMTSPLVIILAVNDARLAPSVTGTMISEFLHPTVNRPFIDLSALQILRRSISIHQLNETCNKLQGLIWRADNGY